MAAVGLQSAPATLRDYGAQTNFANLRAPCRGGITADAIGWLKLGPMDAGGTGEGYCANERMQNHTNTQGLPRFRALVRR